MGQNAKMIAFAEALGVPLETAIGCVVLLWGRVAHEHYDGNLRGVPPTVLESWSGWRRKGRKRGKFARLYRKYFVETSDVGDEVIHGWGERQGALIRWQIGNTLSKSRSRHGDVPGTRAGRPAPTYTNYKTNKERTRKGERHPEDMSALMNKFMSRKTQA